MLGPAAEFHLPIDTEPLGSGAEQHAWDVLLRFPITRTEERVSRAAPLPATAATTDVGLKNDTAADVTADCGGATMANAWADKLRRVKLLRSPRVRHVGGERT